MSELLDWWVKERCAKHRHALLSKKKDKRGLTQLWDIKLEYFTKENWLNDCPHGKFL